MQTHGGEDADAVITSRHRTFRISVLVDWDRDGQFNHALSELAPYISDITTDRDLAGTMPAELLLIEGASAAELDCTISGHYHGLPFTGVFSPYNGRSPFYPTSPVGAELYYQIGVDTEAGTVWYPQFVGNVRTISPHRKDNTVSITALDRVEKLRQPVQFPAWAISNYHANRGHAEASWAESQWVIDHCLRSADTSPTPLRLPASTVYYTKEDLNPTGVHLWLTGTGSVVPSIGWLDHDDRNEYPNVAGGQPMYIPQGQIHPDSPEPEQKPVVFAGTASDASDRKQFWTVNQSHISGIPGDVTEIGFTLITTGRNSNYLWQNLGNFQLAWFRVGSNGQITVYLSSGSIWSTFTRIDNASNYYTASPLLNIPTDRDAVDVTIKWSINPTKVYTRIGDNADAGWNSVANFPSGGGEDLLAGLAQINTRVSMADIYWVYRNFTLDEPPDTPVTREPARYAAVLDGGLNRFSYMPTRKSDDAWTIITEVAAAEFGSVLWDETGVFHFWNYDRMLDKQQTIVRSFTIDEVSDLPVTNNFDSVRNVWSIEVKKKRQARGNIYQAQDAEEFYVPGRTTRQYRFWVDGVVTPNAYRTTRYTADPEGDNNWRYPEWNNGVADGYVVQFFNVDGDGLWHEEGHFTSGVDVIGYQDDQGYLTIRMWNGYGEDARFAINDNQPALHMSGSAVKDYDNPTVNLRHSESVADYGPRNLALSGDWYQEPYQLESLVGTLMDRTAIPIPVNDAITIPGDPRLQLGDTIQVGDIDGLGERAVLQISGIKRAYERDGGLTDTLTVELIKPSGEGVWDSPTYGLWDQSLIWR